MRVFAISQTNHQFPFAQQKRIASLPMWMFAEANTHLSIYDLE
jgi:hypothetical protein